uniref:Ubiquitin carboxyl-terminal hydrolase 36 n=1 Tax=Helobdella robusta TaxID=6412 RepID=T1G6N8_HELRO
MGNTCFVNATLQCLTYTPELQQYMVQYQANHCPNASDCIMCALAQHMQSCFHDSKRILKPHNILQLLKARHMRWGRQEDAHEFLRFLIDALHKSCLAASKQSDDDDDDVSFIHHLFAGQLRSQVICDMCQWTSNTYDPFLDICLDVKTSSSITQALQSFVTCELLDGDNSYFCSSCKKNVTARKLFSIHKPPRILTLQLKRYGMSGGKVTRHITFPHQFNAHPYTSSSLQNNPTCMYDLYAVLVHDGHSTNSGHYYCYVKTKAGLWFCMNDHMVRQSTLDEVLSSEAYLLFY